MHKSKDDFVGRGILDAPKTLKPLIQNGASGKPRPTRFVQMDERVLFLHKLKH